MSVESDFNYAIKINCEELRKKLVDYRNNQIITDLAFDNLFANVKNCLNLIENKERVCL